MKAIVLAAGLGRRMAGMGWTHPKCLLRVGGRTLIENVFTSTLDHVNEIIAVVGHERELVERELTRLGPPMTLVHNPDFATTNTLRSLWLAREHMAGGCLYFNGDVMFDAPIVASLVARAGSSLAIARKSCGEEEVKVILSADRRVTRIGKDLPPADCAGEFIGVGCFDAASAARLCDALDRWNADPLNHNRFFEDALDETLADTTILGSPIEPWRAVEIDTPEDFALAQRLWEV